MQGDSFTSTGGFSAEELELFAYLVEEEGLHDNDQRLIPRRDPNAEIPLSIGQERLWFLDQWDPGNPASNIPFAVRVTGQLSIDAFGRSLNEIVRRHEALRTTFQTPAGQPRQVVAPSLSIPLPLIDLCDLPKADHAAEAQRLIMDNAQHRFSLVRGPLLRAELIRLGEQEHMFLLNVHHVVFDAWSVGLFLLELTMLYDAFVHDKPSPLPELAIQYPDFAIWQRQWLQDEVLQQQLAYWKGQLGGRLPVLELPGDRPRPPILTYEGALCLHTIPPALSQKLTAFSQSEGVTLFMTLFAAFQTLLYRYTGEEDIITGSMFANRDFVDIEALMGLFVNNLLLRTDLSGNPTFRAFLGRVREIALEAFAHQNVPFEQLIEELRPPRDTSHTPMFQMMFILQNAPMSSQARQDLQMEFLRVDNKTSKFDLTLSLSEMFDGLRAVAEYRTDLFDHSTIERLLGHYQVLLEGIVEDADRRLSDLPLLSQAERRQLQAWNDTQAPFSEHACLHQLFEAQAARTPEAIAAVYEDQQLSYRELSQRSNQVAHALGALGVRPGRLVGVALHRSLDLLVALLGVLKTGAAYVPLDPSYPPERLSFMLADARPVVLLTSREIGDWRLETDAAPKSPISNLQSQIIDLDADWPTIAQQPATTPDSRTTPEDLAYVIYTSGSTGRPKGVAIPHRAVVNFLQAMRERPGLGEQEVLLAVTTTAFDIAVLELFLPLIVGARLQLVSREVAGDAMLLAGALESSGANVMQATPATWRMLLDSGWPGSARLRVLCGGEALPRELANRLRQRCGELWNMYGPTETTVWSAALPVEQGEGAVPVGGAIADTQLYILDRWLRPVPVGVPGELYIGGAGVARGYLHRPELTAERFVPNPFTTTDDRRPTTDEGKSGDAGGGQCSVVGGRLYRTGDWVRWRPIGTIEFLGRVDYQVKVRGFRIELGEIEAVLTQQEAVGEAVVVVREDATGDPQLVAYLVLRSEGDSVAPPLADGDGSQHVAILAKLRSQLAAYLPSYMLPQEYVVLEALPRTPNGKVDRKALPAPQQGAAALPRTLVLPRTPVETVLAKLWSEVLGREQIGVEDNFFDIGGHSLKATQLLNRVRETFHVNLPLRSLFQATTVATLTELVIANEARPGQSEKIAQMLLRIHNISPEERQRLLVQKRNAQVKR